MIITNYDQHGKKIPFKKHTKIDDNDQVFVPLKQGNSAANHRLVSATEFQKMTTKPPTVV